MSPRSADFRGDGATWARADRRAIAEDGGVFFCAAFFAASAGRWMVLSPFSQLVVFV
jgi:hypothetical protein